jgi:hypothetical protein
MSLALLTLLFSLSVNAATHSSEGFLSAVDGDGDGADDMSLGLLSFSLEAAGEVVFQLSTSTNYSSSLWVLDANGELVTDLDGKQGWGVSDAFGDPQFSLLLVAGDYRAVAGPSSLTGPQAEQGYIENVDCAQFLAYGQSGSCYWALTVTTPASEVPVPAAAWLFGSALVGLGVLGRKRK